MSAATAVQIYREKVVQALVLTKYYRGGPFIVETMIHYTMIEHFLRRDPDHSISLLLGNLVRVGVFFRWLPLIWRRELTAS